MAREYKFRVGNERFFLQIDERTGVIEIVGLSAFPQARPGEVLIRAQWDHHAKRLWRPIPNAWWQGDLWALLRAAEEGIAQLQGRSSRTVPQAAVDEHSLMEQAFPHAHVAIVCALHEPELRSVLDALDPNKKLDEWNIAEGPSECAQRFYRTSLRTKKGNNLSIVLAATQYIGLTDCAALTTQMLLHFRPRLVLMAGLACGADAKYQDPGDILVAESAFNYGFGKHEHGDFKFDLASVEISRGLPDLIQSFTTNAALFDEMRHEWKGRSPKISRAPRVHMGPLGSADHVVANDPRLDALKSHARRKLVGVDMETYALYRACYLTNHATRFASFKSISDFGDLKNDEWQTYAAYTSARFAVEFIKSKWDELAMNRR